MLILFSNDHIYIFFCTKWIKYNLFAAFLNIEIYITAQIVYFAKQDKI